jgi:signal transduction histidine kinase
MPGPTMLDGTTTSAAAARSSHAAALARASDIGLEGVLRLQDLSQVCEQILHVLESAEPELHISVMSVDRRAGVLRVVAAPRLPEAYAKAVDGLPYGPNVGSCGAAVAEGRRVEVIDILEHRNWAPFRDLARLSGMRACWSVPIFGEGEVIGTFAVYHPRPCAPTPEQSGLIDAAANVVGVVLAHARAHHKLQTTLQRLEFAAEAGGIGIWDWDAQNDRLAWDDRMFALFGVDRRTFGGRFADFRSLVDPEDLAQIEREGHAAMMSGKPYRCEYTITRPSDGARRRIAEHCAPQIDPRTGHVHLIGVDWDVTEQREREEQLRQAQKMEAVGQLTGGVAHDLNNLLTVVLGNLELMEERNQDPRLMPLLDAAMKAAGRGAKLIDQLLSFSRRAVLTPEVLDINQVVGGIEEMLRRSLPETIVVTVQPGADLWQTKIDRNQFENALLNLALNARDAMPAGGEFTISTANTTLLPADCRALDLDLKGGRFVRVTAADTGNGMPPEVAARAFEPFFTTKQVGKGSGLGLSMIYGFMKQSGGAVRLDTAPGAGTRVELYFPEYCPTVVEEPAAEVSDVPRARPGETVLVVEDEDAVREVVVAQVRRLGYGIAEAGNYDEALAVLSQGRAIHLLLTDVVMPGGSGVALAAAARARYPRLRVLFMSGYAADNLDGAVGIPDAPLLTKPVTRARLATAIRRALDTTG